MMKSKSLERLLSHAARRAAAILRDRDKTQRLVDAAMQRLQQHPEPLKKSGLKQKLQTASRMVMMTVRREYPDVPWRSIILLTAGMVYFVMPVDSIPDFIPLLGFTDDVAILAAILSSVASDLDNFTEWEQARQKQAGQIPERDESPN